MGGKFYGRIGFAEAVETSPGVWEERYVEKAYSGDVIRDSAKTREGESANPDVAVDNRISIVVDPHASAHFSAMRYVRWNGDAWKIASVEVRRPRLILSIGGLFREQAAETA